MNKRETSVVKSLKAVAKWTAILLASPLVLYVLWKLGTSVYTVFVPEYGVHCGKSVDYSNGRYFAGEVKGAHPNAIRTSQGIQVVSSVRYEACSGSMLTPDSHVLRLFYMELKIDDVQAVLNSWREDAIVYPEGSIHAPPVSSFENLFEPDTEIPEFNMIPYIPWFPRENELKARLIYKGRSGSLFKGDLPGQYFFIGSQGG